MYFLEDLDEEEYEIAIKVRRQPKLAKNIQFLSKDSTLAKTCAVMNM